MAEHRRVDTYAFHLVWLAIGLTTIFVVQMTVLEFFPMPKGGLGFGLRLALDLAVPFVGIFVTGFAIWLAVAAVLASIKRRFRRAASHVIAIIAIPLAALILGRLFIFDPYYWYVVAHKDRFIAEAKAASKSGSPSFAVLETRDVSFGLATNPPTFISIIYDESDEIGLDPLARSQEWRTVHQEQIDLAASFVEDWQFVKHLTGHFFLLHAGG